MLGHDGRTQRPRSVATTQLALSRWPRLSVTSAALMKFDELFGYEQADIAEEGVGPVGEARQERQHLTAEGIEVGRPGVEM